MELTTGIMTVVALLILANGLRVTRERDAARRNEADAVRKWKGAEDLFDATVTERDAARTEWANVSANLTEARADLEAAKLRAESVIMDRDDMRGKLANLDAAHNAAIADLRALRTGILAVTEENATRHGIRGTRTHGAWRSYPRRSTN